jgi:uncharacterized protein (TIGR02145 family)
MEGNHICYNCIAKVLIIFLLAVSITAEAQQKGLFTDPRDGKVYETVVIGDQRWMANNLDYKTDSGSWCYDNQDSNGEKYGRLYTWTTAADASPSGWHLPSDTEWRQLISFLGGQNMAWSQLKAKTGWNDIHVKVTNNSGFNALPAGHRTYGGIFDGAGIYSYWWSASKFGGGAWYYGGKGNDTMIGRYDSNNTINAFSVRCVQHK